MRPPFILASALVAALFACGDDAGQTPGPSCATGCDVAPENACVDGATLRVYTAPGTCEADRSCAFARADVACPLGCADGACIPAPDPCEQLDCGASPPCHGAGACVDGECVYPPLTGDACDDGDPCTTLDGCQGGLCVGAPLACDAPPASRCLDADRLEVTAAHGSCEDGECVYAGIAVDCSLGCMDGACVGDPCSGIACTSPPSPCHAPVGLCTAGTCDYTIVAGAACDDGDACTSDDRCKANGACQGMEAPCATPPAATCADEATLTVYANHGGCDAGVCSYAPQQVPCAHGCAGGACLGDPCAGVVCDDPPGSCHDEVGTCQNGLCSYAFDDGASCDDADPCTAGDLCQSGSCVGEPVACDAPPDDVCDDAQTLRVYGASGQCGVDGACGYGWQAAICPHGCEDGACTGDPCASVECDDPPLASCAGAGSLTVWGASGSCSGGVCSYAPATTSCVNGCADAACLPPVGLTLSEVLVDSAGFPDTDAFVELHGAPGAALDGVSLVGVNGNGGADYVTIPLTGNLDSAGIFVVAHPSAAPWLADMADVLDARIDLQNGPDNVQLRFGAATLDALGYGSFPAGTAFAGEHTPHPLAAVGASLFRDADFTDTGNNLADFTAGVPTPGVGTPADEPVIAVISAPAGPLHVGDAVTLDASGSTGPITGYAFEFGDGSAVVSGAAATAVHSWDTAGTWTVTLTVVDGAGGSDTATVALLVEDVSVVDDPFDPGSCDGVAWTAAAALARLGGSASVVLDAKTVTEHSRSCTPSGCGGWSTPKVTTISYLTWSGGVTTRYKTLPADTSLVLWNDGGAPRLAVRHATHLSRYPDDHDEGLVFGFPPQTIAYPHMRAYNYFPDNQYDYRDLDQYLGRDARLFVSAGCARFVAVLPNAVGPVTTEYVAVYRY